MHLHKFKDSGLIFLVLYVDGILLANNDMAFLFELKSTLSKNFEMKAWDVSFVIGIQIQRDKTRRILGLSQKAYIDKILDRCAMKNYSNVPRTIYKKRKWKIFHMHQQLEVLCMLKFVSVQT